MFNNSSHRDRFIRSYGTSYHREQLKFSSPQRCIMCKSREIYYKKRSSQMCFICLSKKNMPSKRHAPYSNSQRLSYQRHYDSSFEDVEYLSTSQNGMLHDNDPQIVSYPAVISNPFSTGSTEYCMNCQFRKTSSPQNYCSVCYENLLNRVSTEVPGISRETHRVYPQEADPISHAAPRSVTISNCTANLTMTIQDNAPSSSGRKRKSMSDERPSKLMRNSLSQPVSVKDDLGKVTEQIWDLFEKFKPTQEVFNKKMFLRERLESILLQIFPSCGLFVTGSSLTGLGLKSSDVDMCLMLTNSKLDQRREAPIILNRVRTLFRKHNAVRKPLLIHAKVPILKFKDISSELEVDLNINNATGIRNTQLLTSYARLDRRVSPLVIAAKLWARSQGINDASQGTLSSYSLVLMIIHYLQFRCNPPVLPSLQILQQDKFLPDTDIRMLKRMEDLPDFQSENVESLGELFIGFLRYYAEEYDFSKMMMSVRLGEVLPRPEDPYQGVKKFKGFSMQSPIYIEEPFDLINTARAVHTFRLRSIIESAFKSSFSLLDKTSDFNRILKKLPFPR